MLCTDSLEDVAVHPHSERYPENTRTEYPRRMSWLADCQVSARSSTFGRSTERSWMQSRQWRLYCSKGGRNSQLMKSGIIATLRLLFAEQVIGKVESRTGAGALVFRWLMTWLSPALPQSGLAWLCFLFPLIEPNRRVSRIRLSEKVSRGRPRKAGRPCTELDEPKPLMQSGFRIPFGRRPS